MIERSILQLYNSWLKYKQNGQKEYFISLDILKLLDMKILNILTQILLKHYVDIFCATNNNKLLKIFISRVILLSFTYLIE